MSATITRKQTESNHKVINDDREIKNVDIDASNAQKLQIKLSSENIKLLDDRQCPTFIRKTYFMLESRDVAAIQWSSEGDYFIIKDSETLASEILPRFFKHNKLQSFIRQLNLYGFRKINIEEIMSSKSKQSCYQHQYFIRGRPDLCLNMKNHKRPDSEPSAKKNISNLISELNVIKEILPNMQKDIEDIKSLSMTIAAKFEQGIKRKAARGISNGYPKKNKIDDKYFSNISSSNKVMQPIIQPTIHRSVSTLEDNQSSATTTENSSLKVNLSKRKKNERYVRIDISKAERSYLRPDSLSNQMCATKALSVNTSEELTIQEKTKIYYNEVLHKEDIVVFHDDSDFGACYDYNDDDDSIMNDIFASMIDENDI